MKTLIKSELYVEITSKDGLDRKIVLDGYDRIFNGQLENVLEDFVSRVRIYPNLLHELEQLTGGPVSMRVLTRQQLQREVQLEQTLSLKPGQCSNT